MRPLSWFDALLLKLILAKSAPKEISSDFSYFVRRLAVAFDEINKRRRCTSPQDADEGPR